MFNAKHMFALASFLLAVPVYAQEQPPAGASGSAEPPAQNQKTPVLNFGGIVIQADPLEVQSVSGEVRTFLPFRKKASAEIQASWPNAGDLVSLTYEPDSKGNILKGIKVTGTTIVGTIKEIAADMSWLIVRTQPKKPETAVNVPLQTVTQFRPLVSAMRPGDGIKATYVREGESTPRMAPTP